MAHFNRRRHDETVYLKDEVVRKVPCAGSLLLEVTPRRDPRRNAYNNYYGEGYNSGYNEHGQESYGGPPPPPMHPPRPRHWQGEGPPRGGPGEYNQMSDEPVDANCGELRYEDIGTLVRMRGRVQYIRLNRFISLRDSHGTIQLVCLEERLDLIKRIRNIPVDSHIEVIGYAQERPQKTVNASMATGEIEVVIEDIVDVAAPKRKMYELGGEDAAGRTGKKARSTILITSSEVARCETPAVQRKFGERTHNCGELSEAYVGLEVSLCGWIDNKRTDRFVTLRDGYGTTQLVINPADVPNTMVVQQMETNTVVTVKGKVDLRPAHQRNTRMATGNIEVKVTKIEIVDPREPEPESTSDSQINMEVESAVSSGPPPGDMNSYSSRTHTCGQLRGSDVGKEVVLNGWLDSQRGKRFATIRDGHGFTQLLVPAQLEETLGKRMATTALESVISVKGTVCARPPDQVVEKNDTGEVEVLIKEFTVLNAAKKNMPFVIRERNRPKESVRMQYRYIDLRFMDMQFRLRLRSKVLMKMREFLINERGFVEVETPTLFRRTPGGAQEYVVPTRTEGKFYSLVQSPQQLKQLLMVGAIDRYFQVARCYRDEGTKPDRQPEFTQMDIELSFTNREGVMSLIEDLLKASWPEHLIPLTTPFPVLQYHNVMHWYGTDKPDISFDKKLIDVSELFTPTAIESLPEEFKNDKYFTAKALVFGPNDHLEKLEQSLKECGELQSKKSASKAKLVLVKCAANRWRKALQESLSFLDLEKLQEILGFTIPCSIVVGYGTEDDILPLMGKLRQDVFGTSTTYFHFAWIVDFPLFTKADDGSLEATHHPFTQPHPDDVPRLATDPLKVRGQHFDLVLNGQEVGGGSIRIHNPDLQIRILQDILKIPIDSMSHLTEALKSGAPPHGGIALGMDRLLAILMRAESIRDVIAFPKGVDGKDPVCGAPCEISEEEKKMYHLLPKGK